MQLGQVKSFLGLDAETTGVNTDTDRIVTFSLIVREKKKPDSVVVYWFDPGIPMPPGASAINGITDELIREHTYLDKETTKEKLKFIVDTIYDAWQIGIPVVGSNLPYDLSILDSELKRNGLEPFEVKGPLLDTMVLHRMTSGQKKATLAKMCQFYDIENVTAHDSTSDVIATLDVLDKMIAGSVYLQETTLRDLYTSQRVSHRNHQQNLQDFFNSIGKRENVEISWPIKK